MKYRLNINPGDVFNKWTVISQNGHVSNGSLIYLCRCECGYEGNVVSSSLVNGHSTNCGCYKKPVHGYSLKGKVKPEYTCWLNIKKRCLDITNSAYKDYGAKGITICNEWLSFEQFISDMGAHPFSKATIERIDNTKGYFKGNCRWATYHDQARNKSNNKVIIFEGHKTIAIDWLKVLPIKRTALYYRINSGKTIEQILTEFNLKITINDGIITKLI